MAITFKGSGATTIKVLDLSTPGAQGAHGRHSQNALAAQGVP